MSTDLTERLVKRFTDQRDDAFVGDLAELERTLSRMRAVGLLTSQEVAEYLERERAKRQRPSRERKQS